MLARRQDTLNCGWIVFLVTVSQCYDVTHTAAATKRPLFGSTGGRRATITRFPQDIMVPAHLNVTFVCHTSGDPKPVISWVRPEGKSVNQDTRFTIQEDGGLRIERVDSADEGGYVCQAENLHGSSTATARLTVHARPTVFVTPTNQTVSVHSRVSMDCATTGSPAPAVFWSKEDSDMLMYPGLAHGRYIVDPNGTLSIERASEDDTGYYICSALSAAGSATSRTQLQITLAPAAILVHNPTKH